MSSDSRCARCGASLLGLDEKAFVFLGEVYCVCCIPGAAFCDHEVEPYGDGDWGKCTKCGDDSFPIRLEWTPEMMAILRDRVRQWLDRPGSRRADDEIDLLLDTIRRELWDQGMQ